jgi:predicted RNase H-like HicB family nuclease
LSRAAQILIANERSKERHRSRQVPLWLFADALVITRQKNRDEVVSAPFTGRGRGSSLMLGKKNPLADASDPNQDSSMKVEVEKEEDGRWIAEVPALRGAMAYGTTKKEAVAKVEALVLRVLADKIEHGEEAPELSHVFTVAA